MLELLTRARLKTFSQNNGHTRQPRIVYVDDSADDIDQVEKAFTLEGIECDYLMYPPESYADYDILIVDHNLNGHTTGPAEVARAIRDNQGIAIIVYSGEDRLSIVNDYAGDTVVAAAKTSDCKALVANVRMFFAWFGYHR